LSKAIAIYPLGRVDAGLLRGIADFIEQETGVACPIAGELESPEYAYDDKRDQYNSKTIIKRLLEIHTNHLRLIGVTPIDLFVPILKYVFGLAQMEGPCAVISICRLRPEFYEHPPDPGLLMKRARKTALHELGHSLGLIHCRNRLCIMYAATRIEDIDGKRSHFCPACQDLFHWHFEKISSA
jgi:archaemetzincin